MEVEGLPFLDDGADGDVKTALAAFAEPADRPSVKAARYRFDLIDDFTRPFLG